MKVHSPVNLVTKYRLSLSDIFICVSLDFNSLSFFSSSSSTNLSTRLDGHLILTYRSNKINVYKVSKQVFFHCMGKVYSSYTFAFPAKHSDVPPEEPALLTTGTAHRTSPATLCGSVSVSPRFPQLLGALCGAWLSLCLDETLNKRIAKYIIVYYRPISTAL